MSDRVARERVATLLFYGTLGLLAYFVYLLFRPFFAPLAWAAIATAVFYPLHARIEARFGKSRAAALSTLLVAVVIVVPVLVVMTAFIQQASQAILNVDLSLDSPGAMRLKELWNRRPAWILGRDIGDLDELLRNASAWAAGFIAGQAGALLRNLVLLIVHLIVMLFATFFFLRDGGAIMAAVRRLLPFRPDFSDTMISQANELIRASVFAGLIVATVQGTLGGIAFAAIGLGAPVFWGVIMAFFALLPLGGAWVVWGPAAVWLLSTGQTGRGVALLVFGFFVVGLADNFLRPALVSGRTQLNGLLIFISLLGGVSAFGLVGLVLGPVVMATAIGMIKAYAIERRDGHRTDGVLSA